MRIKGSDYFGIAKFFYLGSPCRLGANYVSERELSGLSRAILLSAFDE